MAESRHGQEIFAMHDNGFLLAESQSKMTPIQRFVYVLAKDHHTDDDHKSNSNPAGFEQSERVRNATKDWAQNH